MEAKKIGFLLYEYTQPMDLIGPWEVLSMWKKVLAPPIELYLISENGGYVQCDSNIVLKSHYSFNEAPKLDILIVPGGVGRRTQVDNKAVISFIQQQAKTCKYLISVCTGMFLLQRAGIFDGKKATTYWRAMPELKDFPNVRVDEERIVKDGKIWSAGGISSGIDLAFALIEDLAGEEIAGKVQLIFEYFPKAITYAKSEMINELPLYNSYTGASYKPYLPEYIREYIEKSRNKRN